MDPSPHLLEFIRSGAPSTPRASRHPRTLLAIIGTIETITPQSGPAAHARLLELRHLPLAQQLRDNPQIQGKSLRDKLQDRLPEHPGED